MGVRESKWAKKISWGGIRLDEVLDPEDIEAIAIAAGLTDSPQSLGATDESAKETTPQQS